MRRHLLLIAAVFVVASCGDSSGPGGGRPGHKLILNPAIHDAGVMITPNSTRVPSTLVRQTA
jgi:hypothetical protein